ncbi:MAG: pyruvate flavodoxin/ferredoxin oxidoreductase [Deltaproteobacteria bacterium]|nr:MAG: pyruvate flavodoxin/ferredoxin oxidoreductase [Deltaproteobacteria bacterium]
MGVLFVDGNQAVAMGAIYAGCTFFAAYPITPASTLLEAMLKALPARGGIVLQGEDEIASIGYCLGASMAGMKTMTATSGPGVSLYSENVSFAIAGEIPIVIVNVMRQGPSTGSATRGADGDIQFMRWGCSGGLPLIVLAPTDVRDCFTLTVHAFNLAERFRCPVFLASNKEIGMTYETLDMDTVEKPPLIDRASHTSGSFLPFQVDTGQDVPAFLAIGGPTLVRQTSSTHGPDGYITADPSLIQVGVERLQRKIEAKVSSFTYYDLQEMKDARILLVAYGITARAARAAAEVLFRDRGTPSSLLVLKTLWPVPERVLLTAAEKVDRVLVLEMNLGQYVYEVRRVLAAKRVDFYGKMSGQLITPAEIVREVLRG